MPKYTDEEITYKAVNRLEELEVDIVIKDKIIDNSKARIFGKKELAKLAENVKEQDIHIDVPIEVIGLPSKISNKNKDVQIIGYYNSSNNLHKGYIEKELEILTQLGFNVESNNKEFATLYEVSTYPTFLFIKNNKLVYRIEEKFMNNKLVKKLYEIGWL